MTVLSMKYKSVIIINWVFPLPLFPLLQNTRVLFNSWWLPCLHFSDWSKHIPSMCLLPASATRASIASNRFPPRVFGVFVNTIAPGVAALGDAAALCGGDTPSHLVCLLNPRAEVLGNTSNPLYKHGRPQSGKQFNSVIAPPW